MKKQQRQATHDAYDVSDKRRIVMKGVINEQESRRRSYVAEIDEGLSSDDEFQEFEQKLIKKAMETS